MTDQTNAGDGDNKNGANGAGANQSDVTKGDAGKTTNQDGQNNSNNQSTTTFDPSKISDEEFEKVFNDKRLFQHSRFKDLTDRANKAKDLEDKETKRQEEELKRKGEFEELAKQKETKVTELQTQLTNERINNALVIASTKLGVVDPEVVLKVIDRSAIRVDETTGAITGAEEALKTLLEAKPFLAGKGTTKLGTGTNPNNQNIGELKRFKHSEIQDPVFYRAHEAEILASMRANLIEDDVNG